MVFVYAGVISVQVKPIIGTVNISLHILAINHLFQLKYTSIIKYVILDSHALNWNKMVNLNSMEEYIQFQSGELSVLWF